MVSLYSHSLLPILPFPFPIPHTPFLPSIPNSYSPFPTPIPNFPARRLFVYALYLAIINPSPNSRRKRFLGDTLVRREDKRDWLGHVADSFSYFRRDQKPFWAKEKIIQFYHATRGIWMLFFSFRTRLRETWEEGLLMEVQFPTTTVRISTTIQTKCCSVT